MIVNAGIGSVISRISSTNAGSLSALRVVHITTNLDEIQPVSNAAGLSFLFSYAGLIWIFSTSPCPQGM
jgi:hypothetical protein